MQRRERTVSFYDLKASTNIRASKLIPVQITVKDALKIAFEICGKTKPTFRDGKVHITLEDWDYHPRRGEYYVLFNRADPTGSDVPFKNLKTGRARMAGKTDDDGIDLSSHVIVRLPRSGVGPALLLMSGGSGLSAAKLATALTRLLRAGAKDPTFKAHFTRENPSGAAGEKIPVNNSLELVGHQSKYLQHILRTGRLEGMELISDVAQKLDSDGSFMITSKVLKVEAVQTGAKMSMSKLLAAIKGAPDDIDRARIKFFEAGETTPQTHTFMLSDIEAAFVMKERIQFETDISPRYETVSLTVIDKMRELLDT